MYPKSVNGIPASDVEDYIKEHQYDMTRKEMAENLGIPYTVFLNFVSRRKLSVQIHRPWTDEELKFLKENYFKMTINEIAKEIGRTPSSINAKAKELDIRKRTRKPWTDEDVKMAIDLYMEGMPLKEIGEKVGHSSIVVAQKIPKEIKNRKK